MQQALPYKMVAYRGLCRLARSQPVSAQRRQSHPAGQTVIATAPRSNRHRRHQSDNAGARLSQSTRCGEFSKSFSGTSSVQNPFAEIDDKTSGGHDSYKALQMSLARRFSSGLTLNSQIHLPRSFGNTSGSNEGAYRCK